MLVLFRQPDTLYPALCQSIITLISTLKWPSPKGTGPSKPYGRRRARNCPLCGGALAPDPTGLSARAWEPLGSMELWGLFSNALAMAGGLRAKSLHQCDLG